MTVRPPLKERKNLNVDTQPCCDSLRNRLKEACKFCWLDGGFRTGAPSWRWRATMKSTLCRRRSPKPYSDTPIAAPRGVVPDRLVFAAYTPADKAHLARHRFADLFLDALPYNAHATANDALWAGLSVVTCIGHKFPGRDASRPASSKRLACRR